MKTEFKVLNWNLGGSKFLYLPEDERQLLKNNLNKELLNLLKKYQPHVVTLQEAVRYGKSITKAEDIIKENVFKNYKYYFFPLIDSDRFSFRDKWARVISSGGWSQETFFSQGNAFLISKDIYNIPLWDLKECSVSGRKTHHVEQVNLDSGIYSGDRNSEPRAALVAHFVMNNSNALDIFVINLHLTTLSREREGIPKREMEASGIRLNQLGIVLDGIISRYNNWRIEKSSSDANLSYRHPPVWILSGDFNFTPYSKEYRMMEEANFIDVVPQKGDGTKAKGVGNRPTLTVDYIFAGPKYVSLDPIIIGDLNNNLVDHSVKVSDHYPMFAAIPILIP